MKSTWLKSIPIALVVATALVSSASAQMSHPMRHSAKMIHSPHHPGMTGMHQHHRSHGHMMAGHHKHTHDMHMAMMMRMHGMKMDAKGHARMMAMHAKHHNKQGNMSQMHATMMASRSRATAPAAGSMRTTRSMPSSMASRA